MQQQIRQGALFLLLGESLLAIMAAIVRHLSDDLSTGQIVFFRNLMGLAALLPLLLHTGLAELKTRHFSGHLTRGLIGITAMYCYFWALAHMPLTEAFLVKLSAPLFMPLFALWWLKEPAGRYSLLALLVGFAGVFVILLPNLHGSSQASWPLQAMLVALAGAMLAALAKVAIRSMSDTESSQRIVFYFAVISAVVTLPAALLDWRPVPLALWGWLVIMGIVASAGQLALTKAYRTAPTGKIGVYVYSAVIYGALMGWWFWDEVPQWTTWAGAALIVAAGLINLRNPARRRPAAA